MRKAIFLDRDGVISDNSRHYYLTRVEDFRFNPGVTEALKELSRRGYLLVVITNQGGIGLGVNTVENVDRIHARMEDLLVKDGIPIEAVYYCPHHHERESCLCRKPFPLMIQKAMARFAIDPDLSWLVGDSDRDMEAGRAAGVRTILVESNTDLRRILDLIAG